jgi:hypothetical protein
MHPLPSRRPRQGALVPPAAAPQLQVTEQEQHPPPALPHLHSAAALAAPAAAPLAGALDRLHSRQAVRVTAPASLQLPAQQQQGLARLLMAQQPPQPLALGLEARLTLALQLQVELTPLQLALVLLVLLLPPQHLGLGLGWEPVASTLARPLHLLQAPHQGPQQQAVQQGPQALLQGQPCLVPSAAPARQPQMLQQLRPRPCLVPQRPQHQAQRPAAAAQPRWRSELQQHLQLGPEPWALGLVHQHSSRAAQQPQGQPAAAGPLVPVVCSPSSLVPAAAALLLQRALQVPLAAPLQQPAAPQASLWQQHRQQGPQAPLPATSAALGPQQQQQQEGP